jgi:hypothetical protein
MIILALVLAWLLQAVCKGGTFSYVQKKRAESLFSDPAPIDKQMSEALGVVGLNRGLDRRCFAASPDYAGESGEAGSE